MLALLAWKSRGLESQGDVLLGGSDGEGKRELIFFERLLGDFDL